MRRTGSIAGAPLALDLDGIRARGSKPNVLVITGNPTKGEHR